MCMHTHACMYATQTNTHMHTDKCIQTHACASTQKRAHTHKYVHTNTDACIQTHSQAAEVIPVIQWTDHPEVIDMSTNQSSLHTNLASGRFYCKSLFFRAFTSYMLLSVIYIYFPFSRCLPTKWFKISRGVTIYCVAKSLQYV